MAIIKVNPVNELHKIEVYQNNAFKQEYLDRCFLATESPLNWGSSRYWQEKQLAYLGHRFFD